MNFAANILEITSVDFHGMNSRDFTNLDQHITDNVVIEFPGTGITEGSRRILLLLRSLLRV